MGGALPVRDLDGVTRKVERWGSSRTAAQRALQDELRQRRGERTELLRPESRFKDAAALWIGKITARREDSTADTYRHWLDGLVLPQLGDLQLHECDVPHIDAFFSRLEQARRTVEHADGSVPEKIRYAANTRRTILAFCSRRCCTRPSPPTRCANWSASSRPGVTPRLPRAG